MWLLLPLASAATFDELLARGPVSVVETTEDSRVQQVTVYAHVEAPVEVVWDRLVAFEAYAGWMPQVEETTVVARTETTAEVAWVVRVPGPNFKFTATYELDPAQHLLVGTAKSGSLAGGKWHWKLSPHGTGTLVERTTYAGAVIDTWIVRSFDDSEHSMELGLNAAVPLIEVRGLKRAVDR